MGLSKPSRSRILFTGVIALAEMAHIAWERFHGGVQTHHLLHRSDLPAVSNWWGVLVLPVLAWLLIGRIQSRVVSSLPGSRKLFGLPANIVAGFVGSLFFGTALAVAFTLGYEAVTSYTFLSLFPIALLFPIYRGEYILGFVLSMTFTFGAVLPTAFGCIFASISALLWLCIRQVRRLVATWRRR